MRIPCGSLATNDATGIDYLYFQYKKKSFVKRVQYHSSEGYKSNKMRLYVATKNGSTFNNGNTFDF